jgi:hypothetical protein
MLQLKVAIFQFAEQKKSVNTVTYVQLLATRQCHLQRELSLCFGQPGSSKSLHPPTMLTVLTQMPPLRFG